MTVNSTTTSDPGRRATAARRPDLPGLLRVVLRLLAVSVFAQAVFAGLLLDGHEGWRSWHATNGMLVLPLLGFAQLALAVLVWRAGRAPGWLPLAGAALQLAIIAQNLLGMSDQLALHVPLGVAIFGLAGALVVRTRGLGRDTPLGPRP